MLISDKYLPAGKNDETKGQILFKMSILAFKRYLCRNTSEWCFIMKMLSLNLFFSSKEVTGVGKIYTQTHNGISRMRHEKFFLLDKVKKALSQDFLIVWVIYLVSFIVFLWSIENRRTYWMLLYRSSRSQMFFKVGVPENFSNFTEKHFCWSLFLICLQLY